MDPNEKQFRNIKAVAEHHVKTRGIPTPGDQDQAGRSVYKKWGALAFPLVFLLGKTKWLLVILKFTKLSTLLTMLVAVWAYAQLWGAPFALGFVLLIYIHELGHMLMMQKMGIKAGAPLFIPFVGAVIAMKELPKNAWVESLVGLGGPLLGTVGAALSLGIAVYTQSHLWFALASTGFMINLFNMLPVSPLDGGRITGVISRWFWLPGFALGGLIFFKTHSPILFLILLIGAFSLFKSSSRNIPGYYDIPMVRRIGMGTVYFALLFLMVAGMWLSDQPLKGLIAA